PPWNSPLGALIFFRRLPLLDGYHYLRSVQSEDSCLRNPTFAAQPRLSIVSRRRQPTSLAASARQRRLPRLSTSWGRSRRIRAIPKSSARANPRTTSTA